jgi:hypothetical protein
MRNIHVTFFIDLIHATELSDLQKAKPWDVS